MGLFDKFKALSKKFDKEEKETSTSIKSESNTKDSFNWEVNGRSTLNASFNDSFNNYNGPVTKNFFNVEREEIVDNALIKARNPEIKKLMERGDVYDALQSYNQLQTEVLGQKLTVDDKFAILNGIYNCLINLNTSDNEINDVEKKIYVLFEAKDFYKFKYLTAIRFFNNQDFQTSIELCDEAISLNCNYHKAKLLKTLIQAITEDISYDEAITAISIYEEKVKFDKRELANVICIKGDVAYCLKKYNEALIYFSDADKLYQLIHYKQGIALCHFYIALNAANANGYISFDKVNYTELYLAVQTFEDIFQSLNYDKDKYVIKRLMPFYLNALEIIDEPQKILKITNKTEWLIDIEDENVSRIKAHAEIKLGLNPVDTKEPLNDIDKLKLEIIWLMYGGKYKKVVEKVAPLVDSLFKNDEQIMAYYLISLSRTDEEEFIKKFKHYKNQDDVKYNLIWIQYLEYKDEIDEAKLLLQDLIKKSPSSVVINDGYRFFKRHGFKKEAFELTSGIMENKYTVLKVDMPEIIKSHFLSLISDRDFDEVERFYLNIDFNLLSKKDKLQIEIEYFRVQGELEIMANKCIELSEEVDDSKTALNGAVYYMKSGELDRSLEVFEYLINTKRYETSELYIMKSQLHLLRNEYEDAYNSAFRAKEIDKDNYKSDSHRFFVTTSMRCNRVDDSVKYMAEFNEEYPKNDFIKTIKLTTYDEDGNEIIDLSEIDKIVGDRNAYINFRKTFINHQIGLSTYCKVLNESKIDFILNEFRHNKCSIKIANGNVESVNYDSKLIKDSILVDSLALIILYDSESSNILDEFETVYVTYSTIEYLQNSLIVNESKVVRQILKLINLKHNVKVVPVKSKEIVNNDKFLDETMHCYGFSYANKIPYLCVDFNLKNIYQGEGTYIVDISSVLKSLSSKGLSSRKLASETNLKLLKKGYIFLTFNALDMIDKFDTLESFESINEEFDAYLCMSRYSDYESYVRVYIEFLMTVRPKLTQEDFCKFVDMIFDYLDRYIGRTRYYFWELCRLLSENNITPQYMNSNMIVYSILKLRKEIEIKKDTEQIYNDIEKEYNYNRIISIVSAVMLGIIVFIVKHKHDTQEYDYYRIHFEERFKFIDKLSLEQVFEEVARFGTDD